MAVFWVEVMCLYSSSQALLLFILIQCWFSHCFLQLFYLLFLFLIDAVFFFATPFAAVIM